MIRKGMSPEKAEQCRIARGFGKGTKLRQMRVTRGLTQVELSALSGVPIKTLQSLESGHRSIDETRLLTLCMLSWSLNCRITDIIEDEELIRRFKEVN